MNKELEEYSFMNSWFVFKKYDKQYNNYGARNNENEK